MIFFITCFKEKYFTTDYWLWVKPFSYYDIDLIPNTYCNFWHNIFWDEWNNARPQHASILCNCPHWANTSGTHIIFVFSKLIKIAFAVLIKSSICKCIQSLYLHCLSLITFAKAQRWMASFLINDIYYFQQKVTRGLKRKCLSPLHCRTNQQGNWVEIEQKCYVSLYCCSCE